MKINFKTIEEARKLLDLEDEVTLGEIQKAFKKLSLKYHPDKHISKDKKDAEDRFKKINHAKDILKKYIAGYRYSFKEKDIKRQLLDKYTYEHLKRFYDDWWGKLDI